MRNRATAERAAPRLGILVSIMLHVGLVAVLFVSFSKKLDIPAEAISVVPVDLVTFADKTNVTPTVKPDEVKPPDVKDVEPTPVPNVAPPKFEVEPDAKPKKQSDAEKFDINDIEKLLAKKKPANAKIASRTVQGVGAGTAMTADLVTLLQNQIYRCWSPPTGTPHPERLIVKYEVFLNRDGSVAQAPQLAADTAAVAARDPYMGAAVGAARRAIYTCSPYRLPADRYSLWRDFTFIFDPRQLDQ